MNDKEAQLIWESYDNKTKAVVKEAIEKHVRKHDNSGFPLTEDEQPTGPPVQKHYDQGYDIGKGRSSKYLPQNRHVTGRQTDTTRASLPVGGAGAASQADTPVGLGVSEFEELLQLIPMFLSGEEVKRGDPAIGEQLIKFYVSSLFFSNLQGSVSNWIDALAQVTDPYGIDIDDLGDYLDFGSQTTHHDPRPDARQAIGNDTDYGYARR